MHNSRFKFLQIKVWDRISTKDVQRCQSGLKSGKVVDPGKKIDFSRQIFENFDFFQALSHNFFYFFRQKLVICSYFWANYSTSLQKSPLSNILPVHDKLQ